MRCKIAYNWCKKHPGLSNKEGYRRLNQYMKKHCIEDNCFLCPMLKFEGIKEEK